MRRKVQKENEDGDKERSPTDTSSLLAQMRDERRRRKIKRKIKRK